MLRRRLPEAALPDIEGCGCGGSDEAAAVSVWGSASSTIDHGSHTRLCVWKIGSFDDRIRMGQGGRGFSRIWANLLQAFAKGEKEIEAGEKNLEAMEMLLAGKISSERSK